MERNNIMPKKIAEQQNETASVQNGESDSTPSGPVTTTYSGSAFETLKIDPQARVTKIRVPSDGTSFALRESGGKDKVVVKMEPMFLSRVKAQIVEQLRAEILAEMEEE